MLLKQKQYGAFTLIELMIAILLLSAITMGMAKYLKSNSASMSTSTLSEEMQSTLSRIRSKIDADIKQAVGLNPSCEDNAPSTFSSGDCSSIEVLGGIVPLPNSYQADVDGLTTMDSPANLTDSSSGFTNHSDALRILQYDFEGGFNCSLNSRHTSSANPSSSSQRFWAHPQCQSLLEEGGLYIISEEIDDDEVIYSNIFQITAITSQTLIDGTIDLQIDYSSSNNLWNQSTNFGDAGYSSRARIYRVKVVEYAVASEGGLWRREITPSTNDLSGYQSWELVEPGVESLQFAYTLGNASNRTAHSRSLSFTSDAWNNGLEDIFGVTPHFVLKSDKPTSDSSKTFDNPLTSAVETDSYPRKEAYFFVAMRNR